MSACLQRMYEICDTATSIRVTTMCRDQMCPNECGHGLNFYLTSTVWLFRSTLKGSVDLSWTDPWLLVNKYCRVKSKKQKILPLCKMEAQNIFFVITVPVCLLYHAILAVFEEQCCGTISVRFRNAHKDLQ